MGLIRVLSPPEKIPCLCPRLGPMPAGLLRLRMAGKRRYSRRRGVQSAAGILVCEDFLCAIDQASQNKDGYEQMDRVVEFVGGPLDGYQHVIDFSQEELLHDVELEMAPDVLRVLTDEGANRSVRQRAWLCTA